MKRMKKTDRYHRFFILPIFILAGLLIGCGVEGTDRIPENAASDNMGEDTGENGEEDVELLLSCPEEKIRSMWMDGETLYVFAKTGEKEEPYGIYEVKEGALLEETPYREIMERWNGEEMKKYPVSSYEYEARLGRNGVVYFLGRDKEGNVKRCYWMEERFYTDILFFEKYEEMFISNIEIGRTGKIYLENIYGGFLIPYDDIYGSIGVGVSSWNKRKTVLGERRMYQFTEGWIYVWDIPSGASMEMIRCDVLDNGETSVFIDKMDGIYLAGESGLAYLSDGGSVWEILVDKEDMKFSDGAFDLRQIWVCEEELYLSGVDVKTGNLQIIRRKIPGRAVKK